MLSKGPSLVGVQIQEEKQNQTSYSSSWAAETKNLGPSLKDEGLQVDKEAPCMVENQYVENNGHIVRTISRIHDR